MYDENHFKHSKLGASFRAIFKKRQNFSIGKPILLESSEAAVFDSKLFILAYYAKLKS